MFVADHLQRSFDCSSGVVLDLSWNWCLLQRKMLLIWQMIKST